MFIIIFFILLFVIAFILAILLIVHFSNQDDEPKSPIGGECKSLNDCVNGATNCIDNICIRSTFIGDTCDEDEPCGPSQTCDTITNTCRISNGEECTNNVDCITESSCIPTTYCDETVKNICGVKRGEGFPCPCDDGLCCSDGICVNPLIITQGSIPEFSEIPNIRSVVYYNQRLLILSGRNTIFYDGEEKESDLDLKEIFILNRRIYSLTEDYRIVRLRSHIDEDIWEWDFTDYPFPVYDISVSLDGYYIWMRDENYGYLFRGEELFEELDHRRRVMGRTCNTYLQVEDNKIVRYPLGDEYPYRKYFLMRKDGDVIFSNHKIFLLDDEIFELN